MELSKFKKYKHLGRVYPETSKYWHPPILEMLEELDKILVPKNTPRFILNFITNLTFKDNGRLKSKFFYKLFKKFKIKGEVLQIKSKFANLRVYGQFPENCLPIIETAEITCDLICEKCGSKNKTRCVTVNGWVTNLCEKCKKK